jgi:hypothetical protein
LRRAIVPLLILLLSHPFTVSPFKIVFGFVGSIYV